MLLSRHSSNPLDLGSSDSRSRNYVRTLNSRTVRASNPPLATSSDTNTNIYATPQMAKYQQHIKTLFPKGDEVEVPALDDGDESMESGESDDEQRSTDEEHTIKLRTQEERDEILQEIAELKQAVPALTKDYHIIDRLGTGTFSSVYKAIDLGFHDKYDNTAWLGHHPVGSSAHYQSLPPAGKAFVAVKRIYVTSNPERIRNEIAILITARGCRHVSQIITAFRAQDQVVVIMPYQRNDDFRDIYRHLPMEGIKAYFRCMFRALRDTHARNMIHRDVKPANFLFDARTGVGTLCDFGLACRMDVGAGREKCLHTPPSRTYPHGRVRGREEYDVLHLKKMQREARLKASSASDKVGYLDKDNRPHSKANRAGTRGFRAPEVLLKCTAQTGAVDVWSAGMILLFFLTGKFPLFQSNDDVEALMEIATIAGKKKMEKVATLHSRTFATNVPSITNDGISWRTFVERQNPDIYTPPIPDTRYYPYYNTSSTHTSRHPPPPSSSSSSSFHSSSVSRSVSPAPLVIDADKHARDLEDAFEFLENILKTECTQRFTPRQALYHPFLAEQPTDEEETRANQERFDQLRNQAERHEMYVKSEPELELGDDEYFPHPFGEGVCGQLHFIDPVTEDARVSISLPPPNSGQNEDVEMQDIGYAPDRLESRVVSPGEGIAIGIWPCEFHAREFGYHAPTHGDPAQRSEEDVVDEEG